MTVLTKNDLKKFISLRNKKTRLEEQQFLIQGSKLVNEALTSKKDSIVCIISKNYHPDFEGLHIQASKNDMERLSTLKTAPDVLAVMRYFTLPLVEQKWTLVLDNINDPGNLGTLIRMANWFGYSDVVCSPETVDIFNPKVVQSSMGSIFRIPIRYADLKEYLNAESRSIYLADLSGESIYKEQFPEKGILCLGSESHGISTSIKSAGKNLFIPGKGDAESLNVAMAGSIISSFIFKG